MHHLPPTPARDHIRGQPMQFLFCTRSSILTEKSPDNVLHPESSGVAEPPPSQPQKEVGKLDKNCPEWWDPGMTSKEQSASFTIYKNHNPYHWTKHYIEKPHKISTKKNIMPRDTPSILDNTTSSPASTLTAYHKFGLVNVSF